MLKLDNAGFYYGQKNWVFRRHSFEIEPGEIVAILGPNGRGKTSLLKSIIGLQALSEGQVSVSGEIGYVPQSTYMMFEYRVLDVVVMGRARHIGFFASPSREDYQMAHQVLQELEIDDFAERSFSQLSGGERQLVLIARAIVSECDIIALDEPASALDFHNQDKVLQTLKRMAKERRLTILFTTHYPQHALYLADQVLLMFDTEAYRFGPVSDLMQDHVLSELYNMPIHRTTLDYGEGRVETVVPVFGAEKPA
jgi:iron complex transport system ATP-binding protein